MTWEAVIQLVLPIVVSGLSSILAFIVLLPTKIGEWLLSHHFEAKIADLKHEQSKELGRLQAELDHMKDRGIRSNELEYHAVKKAWEAYVEAWSATRPAIVTFLEFPDLNQLSEEEVREFLRDDQISDRNAEHIVSAENRNNAYSRHKRAHAVWLAGGAVIDAIQLLEKQSVFIPVDLFNRFRTMLDDLNTARVEQQMNLRPDPALRLPQKASMALIGCGR